MNAYAKRSASSNIDKLFGIVLRSYPSGESDMVLRVLTPEQGKISLYARNSRKSKKRFGSNIEIFDRGEFSVTQRRGSLLDLQGFSSASVYRLLREDFDKLAAASVVCESFDLLIKETALEEHENRSLFELFELTLAAIEEADSPLLICRAVFFGLATLLSTLGFLEHDKERPPSAKSLLLVLRSIEEHAERELLSKSELIALMKRLKG